MRPHSVVLDTSIVNGKHEQCPFFISGVQRSLFWSLLVAIMNEDKETQNVSDIYHSVS
jgi:hypothetical protein